VVKVAAPPPAPAPAPGCGARLLFGGFRCGAPSSSSDPGRRLLCDLCAPCPPGGYARTDTAAPAPAPAAQQVKPAEAPIEHRLTRSELIEHHRAQWDQLAAQLYQDGTGDQVIAGEPETVESLISQVVDRAHALHDRQVTEFLGGLIHSMQQRAHGTVRL